MAKKEDIKNGNDITLDDGNITVLQGTEFSKEKEAEKAEVAVDVPVSEEITPDVKIDAEEVEAPQVEAPTVEEPVVTAPSIDPEPVAPQIPTPDSPSIDISGISSSLSFPSTPEPSISSASDNILSSVPSFGQDNNNFDYKTDNSHDESGSSEIFSSVYDDVNDTKTIAAVVTKEDEANAKKSNLLAYERLYDAGPGKQISILRNFSYEASKWIRAADKSGFVSGEMHDIAKKILREYEGLKEEQQDEFTDDRINSFNNNSNQFNGYSGMSSDGNIVQFPMNNSNDDINKPFAA